MGTNITSKPFRFIETLIHVIVWGIVLGFPFIMMSRSGFAITWHDYLLHSGLVHLFFLIVFYLNYFVFIPQFLFARQLEKFIICNIILLSVSAITIHFGQDFMMQLTEMIGSVRRPPRMNPPKSYFILRDLFSMILTIGLSVAIQLSKHWMHVEAERQEAEKHRTEAELKNLRNQLNPHFLLNTLSNIYALISFNKEKAKMAVQELSKLLRYVWLLIRPS